MNQKQQKRVDSAKATTIVDTPHVVLLPAVSGTRAIQKAKALNHVAKGKTAQQAAELAGCSKSSVDRAIADNRDWLEAKREEWQRRFLTKFESGIDARLEDAATADSRTGAQSFKNVAEAIYGLGGNQTNVHVGDVHQSLTINSDAAIDYDADEYAKMRDSMGL